MSTKTIRRVLIVSALSLAATACGKSSITSPDCIDPSACTYIPDSGGFNGGTIGDDLGYIPDSGG